MDFKSIASAYSATAAYSLVSVKTKRFGCSPQRLVLEAPPGLEPGVKALQASALPLGYGAVYGGNNRARTYDPLLVRQMLSQLS